MRHLSEWEAQAYFAGTVNLADPAGGWLLDWANGGMPSQSGITLSPEGALSLSFVWACVSARSEDIAKLPWSCRKSRDDGGSDPAPDHFAHWLVSREWNPTLPADVAIAMFIQWEALWGNAYAEIVRDGSNRPAELWPIHPARVTVRSKGREVWYEVKREAGSRDPDVVFPGNMLHLRGMGDALQGYSVIRTAREAVGMTAAAESFGASFFGNDATMGMAVTTPQELKPEGREALQKSLNAIKDKRFRFIVLPGGVKPERMMVPPEDIQFLDTRKFQGSEVCRLFRTPLHKVGLLDNATFSNIEHQAIEYATDTLQPPITRLEKEFARKLIAPSAQGSFFIKANMNALLRGDYATRTTGYRSLISTGAMKPNEARVLEDMNPSTEKGMDMHWMQGAMQPVEILAEGPPEPAAPPPPPPPGDEGPEPDGEEPEAKARPIFDTCLDGPVVVTNGEALLPVFMDTATRCVRRERHALAQRKAKGSDTTFASWLPKFYRGHRAYVEQQFLPCFAAAGRGPNGAWSTFLDVWERSAAVAAQSGAVSGESEAASALCDGAMESIR